MINRIVGIDLSLRKTGIVCLNNGGDLIGFRLNICPIEYKNEDILIYNQNNIIYFLNDYGITNNSKNIVAIEGLSFNSPSSVADLISANWWILRSNLKSKYPNINTSVVTSSSWKSKIFTSEEIQSINKEFPIIRAKRGIKLTADEKKINNKTKANMKIKVKNLITSKVPANIKAEFDNYIKDNKYPKDSIFDLCDAYHIAQYFIKD